MMALRQGGQATDQVFKAGTAVATASGAPLSALAEVHEHEATDSDEDSTGWTCTFCGIEDNSDDDECYTCGERRMPPGTHP